jgi:hypothetical protein
MNLKDTSNRSVLPQSKEDEINGIDFYHWPVLFAILPPVLSIYLGGKVEEWNEGFLLIVIAFYLFALVKGTSKLR